MSRPHRSRRGVKWVQRQVRDSAKSPALCSPALASLHLRNNSQPSHGTTTLALARDTMFSALGAVAGTGGRLVVTALIARKLAPDIYGQFVFTQFLIDFIALICSFGVPGVLTRFLPQLSNVRPDESRAPLEFLRISAAASLLLSTMLALGYGLITKDFVATDIALIGTWCLLNTTLTFVLASFQGILRFDCALVANLTYAVAAPVAVTLLFTNDSLDAAVSAVTSALAVTLAAALLTWRLRPRGPPTGMMSSGVAVRDMVSYGFNVWLTGLIVGLVWSRGEFAILRGFAQDEQIGLYAVAITLSGMITQGAGLFTGALAPHLVRHSSDAQSTQLIHILKSITSLLLVVVTTAAALLIGLGQLFIIAIFGHAYLDAYVVLCTLALGAVAIVSGPASLLLQIKSNARFGLWTNALALVVLLTVSAILTPAIGLLGAAAARALSQGLVAAIACWQLSRWRVLADTARRTLYACLAVWCALSALMATVLLAQPNNGFRAGATLVALFTSLVTIRFILKTDPLVVLPALFRRPGL